MTCFRSSETPRASTRRKKVEDGLDNINILLTIIDNHGTLNLRKQGPSGIDHTQLCYVDATSTELADIAADGCCSWRHEGKYTWQYKRDSTSKSGFKCTRRRIRQSLKREELAPDIYRLVKVYYKNDEYSVKRYIVYLESSRQKIYNNIVVVGYIFNNEERLLLPTRPHGNAIYNTNAYTKVKPSAVTSVEHRAKAQSLSRAMESHIDAHGGREAIPPELRATFSQVQYRKRGPSQGPAESYTGTGKSEDLETFMAFAHDNPQIVRSVSAHPEPHIVMATDQQLRDLARFAKGWFIHS